MTTTRLTAAALLVAMALAASPVAAQGGCGGQTSVRFKDDVKSMARRCGINVEALKQANPGIGQRDLKSGGFVKVPSPALPSPQLQLRGSRGVVTLDRR